LKTVLPKIFFTVKITGELSIDLKVIFVEFVNGLGTADSFSIDFSCENPIEEIVKIRIKSNFLTILEFLKS